MSRRGENIYKRKDNRWEGRYIKNYDENGKPIFGYVYAKSYKEVKEKLLQAKQKVAEEGFQKPVARRKFKSYCNE